MLRRRSDRRIFSAGRMVSRINPAQLRSAQLGVWTGLDNLVHNDGNLRMAGLEINKAG